ncbi:DUF5682 family protein [Thermoflavimicrobium dichotomicum]|uniref:Uncharacterized protein n=1 Tax=Thermoflavimicrobium dichotomicum TaxID=46223 RepID=A0A1I3LZU5_9BACL|nr:DUF5682 family protein [Thermoflavimicrobium dichotomicum]SFI90242.1 hypothetical protein SAMN05421852_102389 [Thermoflavimicrobium dichotomicum]
MSQIIFLPIRHHSPVCAFHVQQKIREVQPSRVLIEGPSDANALLPYLLEEDLRLPVAIYAYQTDESPHMLYYPLCEYSPEYVAIQTGNEVGAACSFMDIPSAWMMKARECSPEDCEPLWESGTSRYTQALARQQGFDSFEEFWEARFEIEGFHKTADQFFAEIGTYGSLIRQLEEQDDAVSPVTIQREAYMVREIVKAVREEPTRPIVVICGAAHLNALEQGIQSFSSEDELSSNVDVPAEVTLIPYSYHRLSEQSGYGAGNQAPRFYQLVWEAKGDTGFVVKKVLVEQLKYLRRQGYGTNLSHAIEAGKLGHTLALIRGKRAPGLKEVMDATVSCYGEGYRDRLLSCWRETLIGSSVGILPSRIAQTPLQREFYSHVQQLGIPLEDIPKSVQLQLTQPTEQMTSVFLHRLRLLGIPFGTLQMNASVKAYQLLTAVRERWEVVWTPATDAQLIEFSAYGSTLEEACSRYLMKKLEAVKQIDEVTEILLQMGLTQLEHLFPQALRICESLSSEDRNFTALSQGVLHVATLLKYGTARKLSHIELFTGLLEKLMLRAIWTLLPATVVDQEGAHEILRGIQTLYDVLGDSKRVERTHFIHALNKVIERKDANPLIRGFSLSLLYLMGQVSDEQLEITLQSWLRTSEQPDHMTYLIQGLFHLNRAYFIRKQGLIQAIHTFVVSLDKDTFVRLLPMLRQVFSQLSPMDGRNLTQTLAKVLDMDQKKTQSLVNPLLNRDRHLHLDQVLAAMAERWKNEYGLS